MKINTLTLAPFAGINRLEVSFAPGLNVLLGPNEAGKSTVVEGLYAALFQQIKLKRSVKADQEFHQKARRYPDGDHAHLQVTFADNKDSYSLTKHWQQGKSYIEYQQGQTKMMEEEAIGKYMETLFPYGPQTYANVMFARQTTFQNTLETLEQDAETSATVDQILKKAVMQLDGVSVEALRRKLEQDMEGLGKRWDLLANRPENNRTIQNPYKTGIGEVVKAYYTKEGLRRDLGQALRGEASLERMNDQIQGINQSLSSTAKELEQLEPIEPQITQRETHELRLGMLVKEYRQLLEINREWPVKESEFQRLQPLVPLLAKEIAGLKQEMEQIRELQLLQQDRQLIEQADNLKAKIDVVAKAVESAGHVTEEKVKEMEQLERAMIQTKAALDGVRLMARLNQAPLPVTITAGIDPPVYMEMGQQMPAKGSVILEMGEGKEKLSFQVSAADMKVEEVRADYARAAERKVILLKELKASSVEEARQLLYTKKEKVLELHQLQQAYENLVEKKDLESIRKALDQKAAVTLRPIKDVSEALQQKENALGDTKRQILMLESQLKQWADSYKSHDHLLEELVDKKADIKSIEDKLKNLATLPENFKTPEEFRTYVAQLRKDKNHLSETLYQQKESLSELQHSLPNESSEELTKALEEAEGDFQIKNRKLEQLVVIWNALEKVINRLDQSSGKPLEEAFCHYMEFITDSKYKKASLNPSFQVTLQQQEDKSLVPTLFSAGTRDTVALAFRFALVDQLFPQEETLLVLDDCLVNLDPDRKAKTIQLIREKADQHQIIFTTCHPETAAQLGGNIIQLG